MQPEPLYILPLPLSLSLSLGIIPLISLTLSLSLPYLGGLDTANPIFLSIMVPAFAVLL
jgi:hypothetical protein